MGNGLSEYFSLMTAILCNCSSVKGVRRSHSSSDMTGLDESGVPLRPGPDEEACEPEEMGGRRIAYAGVVGLDMAVLVDRLSL